MIKRVTKVLSFFALLGCLDPYEPPVTADDIDILVVDGFINTTDKTATVKLSRAVSLGSKKSYPAELKAKISIENTKGVVLALPEKGAGIYEATGIAPDFSAQYRLLIETLDKKKFASDFIELRETPAIDNITWEAVPEGTRIYLDTHDSEGKTRYYQWSYSETWEYTARFNSRLKFLNGKVVQRPDAESIYTCWKTENSPGVLIGSTVNLTNDVVSRFPLALIPNASVKLSRLYSIDVQQRAITKEAFGFWQQLQKTTQNLGGLFDPLPSQVLGNVHDAEGNEPVLGYFSGGSVSKKRIFIGYFDLPQERRSYRFPTCPIDTIFQTPADLALHNMSLLISYLETPASPILTSTNDCIDCRLAGGNTTKPSFWP